jgi:hypothetical protein
MAARKWTADRVNLPRSNVPDNQQRSTGARRIRSADRRGWHVSRFHQYHRARRHGDADIKFAANERRQNQRTCWILSVWKLLQIKATGPALVRIPAVWTAFVLVHRGFSISGESRQEHHIPNEADPNRRSYHRDGNPVAKQNQKGKHSDHARLNYTP